MAEMNKSLKKKVLYKQKVLQAIENMGGRIYLEEGVVFDMTEMQFQDHVFDGNWVWWNSQHFKNGEVTFEEHKELFNNALYFFMK